MNGDTAHVVYWDASAILAALFREAHSATAMVWAARPGEHLMSSLAWAEAHAVIARLLRQTAVTQAEARAASRALTEGPWRRVDVRVSWDAAEGLAAKWPLRGADLWHLTAAVTLREELPELVLLTFDGRLRAAATAEGVAAESAPSDG